MRIVNHVTKHEVKADTIPSAVMDILPIPLQIEIRSLSQKYVIEEIRLRQSRYSSLVCDGKNIMLNTLLDSTALSEILKRMCGGSLYAYSDTINKGYIALPGGIRVGIGGRAASDGDKIVGVYDVSLLCIRIPHPSRSVGKEICDILKSFRCGRGVLVYSPPGVGKTTLLRGIANIMASGENAKRVVVIDTRGELSFCLDSKELCLDVLSGYPKRLGIEIATRTLNAELMICDEIGDYEEAMALVASNNCGVPLVASAHASSVGQLLNRTGIRLLHEAGIFGAYVGIERDGRGSFVYDITYKEGERGAY